MQTKNTVPNSSRKSNKKAHHKAIRCKEAIARQAAYDALSPDQQRAQREFFRSRYLTQKEAHT